MPIFRKNLQHVPQESTVAATSALCNAPNFPVLSQQLPVTCAQIVTDAVNEIANTNTKEPTTSNSERRRGVIYDGNVVRNHANPEELKDFVENQCHVTVSNFSYNVVPITLESSQLYSPLLHNIKHCQNYTMLLPLQEKCLSILLHECRPNVLVQSPTGSGKTAAFGIPAIQLAMKYKGENVGPSVIIVCNTMNLASQIHDHLALFAGKVTVRTNAALSQATNVQVFGMFAQGDEVMKLNRGTQPDIVVATMGMLLSSLEKKKLLLDNLKLLIMDEADKMMSDRGFENEMIKLLEILDSNLGDASKEIQKAAFSATYSNYENDDVFTIDGTLAKFFGPKSPAYIKVYGVKGYITQRIILIPDNTLASTKEDMADVNRIMEFRREVVRNTYHAKKLGWLQALLDKDRELYCKNGKFEKTAVIFVERIVTSNFLAVYLLMKGYKVAPLNSNYDLKAVKETITKLTNGELQAVISTNKLARGQDIPDLHHVIVFEMSHEFDDYKHRIGRTGRIGKGGISTALVTSRDVRNFCNLYVFLKEHGQRIPRWLHEHYESTIEQRKMFQPQHHHNIDSEVSVHEQT